MCDVGGRSASQLGQAAGGRRQGVRHRCVAWGRGHGMRPPDPLDNTALSSLPPHPHGHMQRRICRALGTQSRWGGWQQQQRVPLRLPTRVWPLPYVPCLGPWGRPGRPTPCSAVGAQAMHPQSASATHAAGLVVDFCCSQPCAPPVVPPFPC